VGKIKEDDETEVRESGPLESNLKKSFGKIETTSSASLTQRNEMPEMCELPIEILKSSRAKGVEINLPPRGA